MTDIRCDCTECRWCIGGTCEGGMITMDGDHECENYQDITELPEYQNVFYKRCIKGDDQYKKKFKGKKLEINEITYYTEWSARPFEDWQPCIGLTEAITGVYFSYSDVLKHSADEIRKIISDGIEKYKCVPLDNLPEKETSDEQ